MNEVIFYTVSSSHSHISTIFLIFFVLLKFIAFIFSTDSLDLFYGLFLTFLVFCFLHVFVTNAVYRFFSDQSFLLLSFFPIFFLSFTIISFVFITFFVLCLLRFFAFSRIFLSKFFAFIFFTDPLHLFYGFFFSSVF